MLLRVCTSPVRMDYSLVATSPSSKCSRLPAWNLLRCTSPSRTDRIPFRARSMVEKLCERLRVSRRYPLLLRQCSESQPDNVRFVDHAGFRLQFGKQLDIFCGWSPVLLSWNFDLRHEWNLTPCIYGVKKNRREFLPSCFQQLT